ncbi:hypothetical protein F5X96DRAFT_655611 [Biscogniauxia mediterranea]|nr:hypothetical protein F5X96DRAFT_655611 [Biscogniauxia mediterranea]
MAIIPELEGLEVTILISETPCREYRSREAVHLATRRRNHLSVKYIEAVTGDNFAICIKKTSAFQQLSHHIGCRLVIDGKECGYHQERGQQIRGDWTKMSRASMVLDEDHEPMHVAHRFGDPQNVEDGLSLPEEPTHNGSATACRFGRIRVEFYRLLNMQASMVLQQIMGPNAPMSIATPLYELIPYVRYPLSMTNGYTPVPAINFQDPFRRPFATFEFRYGSKDDLVRAGVTPENPMNGTSMRPMNGTSVRPVNGTSVSPMNGTSVSPMNTTPESPMDATPESPVDATPESPISAKPEESA